MAYLIGTDEAGYGPRLGPLVVAATVWHVPDDPFPPDLYSEGAALFAPGPTRDFGRVAVADSKRLYRSGGSLAPLETAVLTALATLDFSPAEGQAMFSRLEGEAPEEGERHPWQSVAAISLPAAASRLEVQRLAARWQTVLAPLGIELRDLRARILHPPQLNNLFKRMGNKAEVLSATTLRLVRRAATDCGTGRKLIVCDRHGGRKQYREMVQAAFECDIASSRESDRESRYRLREANGDGGRRGLDEAEICFRVGGESFLPSALASMISKYVREVAMMAFNRFWAGHVPGLQATAGYPLDAKRFFEQTADARKRLDVAEDLLWRCR